MSGDRSKRNPAEVEDIMSLTFAIRDAALCWYDARKRAEALPFQIEQLAALRDADDAEELLMVLCRRAKEWR